MKKILAALALVAATLSATAQTANQELRLSASAARTTGFSTADQTNTAWRGGHFIFNITAYNGGAFTPTIQGKDPVSGNYYTILAGSAQNTTGTVVLKVYPGITAAANASVSDILPKTWRINVVNTTTPVSFTYSIGGVLEQ